ncbi:MAG: SPOR domain-containing protein [Tropicimonas sp.]
MIRNTANGRSVAGALFKREREHPGPKFQVSSDAAASLELLAGQPTVLEVTALRRVAPASETPEAELLSAGVEGQVAGAKQVSGAAAAGAVAPAASATAVPRKWSLRNFFRRGGTQQTAGQGAAAPDKPYVEVSAYPAEGDALETAEILRRSGLPPEVYAQDGQAGKTWRVVIGPAASTGERDTLLRKAGELGFADAYAVAQ